MAEGRMVNVSIANDIDKVALLPPAVQHLLFRNGKEVHNVPPKEHIFVIIADGGSEWKW